MSGEDIAGLFAGFAVVGALVLTVILLAKVLL